MFTSAVRSIIAYLLLGGRGGGSGSSCGSSHGFSTPNLLNAAAQYDSIAYLVLGGRGGGGRW